MQQLPAFPDVKSALTRLKKAGHRLATLTNSNEKSLERQLEYAELTDYFECSFSVGQVQKFKPAADTYRFAAEALQAPPSEILMVAAHPWDLLGASHAGCKTAFVARPGTAPFRYKPTPDFSGKDLHDIANQISGASQIAAKHSNNTSRVAIIVGGLVTGIMGISYLSASLPARRTARR